MGMSMQRRASSGSAAHLALPLHSLLLLSTCMGVPDPPAQCSLFMRIFSMPAESCADVVAV